VKIRLTISLERGPRKPSGNNRSGQAYALTVLTPILPGQKAPLDEYLRSIPPADSSPFIRAGGTHFARFVILDHLVFEGPPQKRDELKSDYLLFESNFDGDLDPYLEKLRVSCGSESDAIWGKCVGYPGIADAVRFRAYFHHNQIDTNYFSAAYPNASVGDVLEALALQRRIVDFGIANQDAGAAELQRAFRESFDGAGARTQRA
jgi:hypothetical protein